MVNPSGAGSVVIRVANGLLRGVAHGVYWIGSLPTTCGACYVRLAGCGIVFLLERIKLFKPEELEISQRNNESNLEK